MCFRILLILSSLFWMGSSCQTQEPKPLVERIIKTAANRIVKTDLSYEDELTTTESYVVPIVTMAAMFVMYKYAGVVKYKYSQKKRMVVRYYRQGYAQLSILPRRVFGAVTRFVLAPYRLVDAVVNKVRNVLAVRNLRHEQRRLDIERRDQTEARRQLAEQQNTLEAWERILRVEREQVRKQKAALEADAREMQEREAQEAKPSCPMCLGEFSDEIVPCKENVWMCEHAKLLCVNCVNRVLQGGNFNYDYRNGYGSFPVELRKDCPYCRAAPSNL